MQPFRHSIALDAKRIVNNRTGLGNYSRFVVRSLAEARPDLKLLLMTARKGDPSLYSELLDFPNVELRQPEHYASFVRKLPGFTGFWRSRGITRDLRKMTPRPLLYHGLSNEIPSGLREVGIPSVVTIHDLIYERHPEYYHFFDAKIYHYKYKRSCREATHIIACSDRTKFDIVELYNIDPAKITVVYQGCNARFRQPVATEEIETTLRRWHIDYPYILSVGTIEERKNAKLIVEALPHLRDKVLQLILVGRPTAYTKEVIQRAEELGVTDRLHVMSDIHGEDLPALYHGAELFVYPSRYEGFGIPILEALCCSTPVIGATGSCLEEAGGPHSLYVNPDDYRALAIAIDKVLASPSLRQEMVAKGLEWSEKFTPENSIRALLDVYNHLLPQLD